HTAPLMHEVLAHAAALLCLVAALVLPGHALERAWLRGADLGGRPPRALFAGPAPGATRPAVLWTLAAAFAAAALAAQLRFGPARGEPLDLAYLAAVALASAPFLGHELGHQLRGGA